MSDNYKIGNEVDIYSLYNNLFKLSNTIELIDGLNGFLQDPTIEEAIQHLKEGKRLIKKAFSEKVYGQPLQS